MINRNKPMAKSFLIGIIIFLWGASLLAHAASQDIYQFSSKTQQQNFDELTQEFRCLVCQNESLADSNASLASDLRKQIADLIRQGNSKQQIKEYLVQRYGQFILFKPPFEASTYLLWLGPFILLIVSIVVLLYSIKKHKQSSEKLMLSAAEQQTLNNLLAKIPD